MPSVSFSPVGSFQTLHEIMPIAFGNCRLNITLNGLLHRTLLSTQSNLPSMGQDIEKRSYFLKKAISLLDRKADMDLTYASTLDNLIIKDYLKPVNI